MQIDSLQAEITRLDHEVEAPDYEIDSETLRELGAIDDDPLPALPIARPVNVLPVVAPALPNPLVAAAGVQTQATLLVIPPNQTPLTFTNNNGYGTTGPNAEVFVWATPRNLDIERLLGAHEVSIEELLTVSRLQ
jgi:hypothetical protein